MADLKLISWNVNGIRAIIKKDFLTDVKEMNPDILCLQETKAQPEDAKTALDTLPDYKAYINSSKARKGYSGTAILTKNEPISVTYDMGIEEHDQEGRVITAEFDNFFLVTVYTPNSGAGMKRLDYRATWDVAFRDHLMALDEKKPVIVCGDLNVAHREIDIARPKANYNKTSGYTQTEIDGLDNILSAGFVDTFRHFYPEEVKYSWWNYKFKARERNVGWRIDYFLVSERLKDQVKSAEIHNDRFGSDHCPVSIDLKA
ncbi:exodeoxyribonuclease III [Marinoscillum furvescens]|uniref:Exodeoxyribonuclease-3 n=1 Tax=Marinoscillum furvescens DSM 4134 TaxID=1122208 RepID=A0A3D9L391_MARFU|nr:exodeoxyribonuclease III [Marinoscillum furvescens]RED99754.1 exodeoxyribonuclease-3 [Marinoscillum furvescens DSM 4134]